MNRPAYKNIALFSAAVIILCTVVYFVDQRDTRVVDLWNRNKYTVDSVYISVAERVEAIQFGDSILPALRQKGLVISIERNDLGTTVVVSGSVWKERSLFFKENFLKHLSIYNKVHRYPPSVTIADQQSGRIYAQIFHPDRKQIYE